jgi:hypothetical protein
MTRFEDLATFVSNNGDDDEPTSRLIAAPPGVRKELVRYAGSDSTRLRPA